MAITQAVCNSFKKEILEGVHDLENGGDVFKLALYKSTATINAATTAYTATGEVSASGQYAAKGGTLASQQTSLAASGVAIVDFADLSFTGVTLTARGALIYNSTEANKAVCALDFGADKTATSGTFTIQFPNFTSSAAILRIA
jgi:hypothetical protein|tara:strand:+ start:25 stop:456 length:432 start_codon:yes stop_codon:yes gene_type:complete